MLGLLAVIVSVAAPLAPNLVPASWPSVGLVGKPPTVPTVIVTQPVVAL